MGVVHVPPPHVLSGSFTLNRNSAQSRGLAAWFPLGVDTRRDWLNPGNPGAFAGNAARAWDAEGAYLFADGTDASGDALQVASHARIDFASDNFTVSLWAWCSGFVAQGSSVNTFITKGGITGNPGWGIGIRSDESLSCWVNAFEVNPAISVNGSVWMHLAMTRNTTGDLMTVFHNGASAGSGSPGTGSVSNATNLEMGGEPSTHVSRYAACRIRDVRLYKRILSAREIAHLYAPATRYELFRGPKKTYSVTTTAYTVTGLASGTGLTAGAKTVSATVPSGTDKLVVCVSGTNGSGSPAVSSLTWNGVSMTLAKAVTTSNFASEIWYLDSPDSGTHDVVVDWGGTASSGTMSVLAVDGAATGAPEATASSIDTSSDTSTETSITSISNGALTIESWCVSFSITGTPQSGQVEVYDLSDSGGTGGNGGAAYDILGTAGASSQDYAWSAAAQKVYAIAAWGEPVVAANTYSNLLLLGVG